MTRKGFTLVELMLVLAVIAILATIGIVGYRGVQRRSADSVTAHTVSDAMRALQLYYVNNKIYPSNLADTEYAPPQNVAVALYTNSPQVAVYAGLSSDENAQLFINTCTSVSTKAPTLNYTGCNYNGNNVHVKGTVSANIVIKGPVVQEANFDLDCSSTIAPAICQETRAKIVQIFKDQGGTFPIYVPKKEVALPAPTMKSFGTATKYCIIGSSAQYPDISYYATADDDAPRVGASCKADSELHYP